MRSWRSIAAGAGVLLLLGAMPAQAQQTARTPPRTAGELATICTLPTNDPDHTIARFFCLGVLYGVSQYHAAAHPVGSPRPPIFCAPEPPPRLIEVSAAFAAWMRANPQHAGEQVADGLMRFAAQTYPCPPPPAAPAPAQRRR